MATESNRPLSKLATELEARSDPSVVWMALAGERVTLLDGAADLAAKILPKYDLFQMQPVAVGARQAHAVGAKLPVMGRLLAGLLFAESRKVEVYQLEQGAFRLTHSATPGGDHSCLDEFMGGEDENGDAASSAGSAAEDLTRPVLGLTAEKSGDGLPRLAAFILHRSERKALLCSFVDNGECDRLESILEQVAPVECRVDKSWDPNSKAGQVRNESLLLIARTAETSIFA